MSKHIYQNHLGGVYVLDHYEDTTICERCWDEDVYLGEYDLLEELLEDSKDEDSLVGLYSESYLTKKWNGE
ncbi:hypothetical protein ACWOEY_11165 [Enterococcus sulfureus]